MDEFLECGFKLWKIKILGKSDTFGSSLNGVGLFVRLAEVPGINWVE